MKDAAIKKAEVNILEWLESYEAWNEAYKILCEHNSEPYLKPVEFFFDVDVKEWLIKEELNKKRLKKISQNSKKEEIAPLCYVLEFVKNRPRPRNDEAEFDDLVEALIEGTKEYIKRFYV